MYRDFRGSRWSPLVGSCFGCPNFQFEFHNRDSLTPIHTSIKKVHAHTYVMRIVHAQGWGDGQGTKITLQKIVDPNIPFLFPCDFNNFQNVILLRWVGGAGVWRVEFQEASFSTRAFK